MIDPDFIFFFLLISFGLVYVYLVGMYTLGWFRLKEVIHSGKKGSTAVSIIVPSRDEEVNILNILTDLANQDYPFNLYEIIVIDDNSRDNTALIVNYFISQNPDCKIQLIRLTEDHPHSAFKKKAIDHAISASSGELIITTDADCRIGPDWLKIIVGFYEREKPKMIVGPVSFHNEKSLFEKMQTIEFLSLIAITAGAIRMGRPVMCNGANLTYQKKAFQDVGGFGDDTFSSGDDVFLLIKMKKKFGGKSVRFLKHRDAIVYTEAKKNLREFIHQRVRWASKNKGYDIKILLVSFTVYMMNLLIVGGLIGSIFYQKILPVMLVSYLLILLAEVPILIGIGIFAKRIRILFYSIPLIIFYPVYIIITGALGIIANYQWKGRTVKK
jgi:cellulose synthase/poly-beta-1,6-N-acetylglucosamine synthase-like glycosyltransferase